MPGSKDEGTVPSVGTSASAPSEKSSSNTLPPITNSKSAPTSASSETSAPESAASTAASEGSNSYKVNVEGSPFVREGYDVVCENKGDQTAVAVNSAVTKDQEVDENADFLMFVTKGDKVAMMAMQSNGQKGTNLLSPDAVTLKKSGNKFELSGQADFVPSDGSAAPTKKNIDISVTCP